MGKAGIFYGHLEYFTVLWYILWPFGNVVVIWYIFPRFGILRQEKSGNPALNQSNHHELCATPALYIKTCSTTNSLHSAFNKIFLF
jgi:hypothetical protein